MVDTVAADGGCQVAEMTNNRMTVIVAAKQTIQRI